MVLHARLVLRICNNLAAGTREREIKLLMFRAVLEQVPSWYELAPLQGRMLGRVDKSLAGRYVCQRETDE